eukprot:TRINITY_DN94178_c0_g1_i1.p1 TRINITY_DN94178_c0_g1~~TRINITY_DN94178_c0_g1_i1.p1  ORF type:complete len:181 (+),score=23.90 TRINITY_DN94178_c0_g1_i1:60-602(+)
MTELLVQGSGWLGFILCFAIPWMPNKLSFLACDLSCSFAFLVHNILIGAWGGVPGPAFNIANSMLSYLADLSPVAKRVHGWLWLFLLPLAYYSVNNAWDLLPQTSAVFKLVAMQQTLMFRMRLMNLLSQLPLVPYNLHVGSQPQVLSALIFASMCGVNIFLHDRSEHGTSEKSREAKKTN